MAKIHIKKDQDTVYEASKANSTWFVDEGVTLSSDTKAAFHSDMDDTKVVINGSLEFSNITGGALSLYGGESTAIIGKSGTVSSDGNGALLNAIDQKLINHGDIEGARAVRLLGGNAELRNTGDIVGLDGEGVYVNTVGAIEITNAQGGLIKGDVGIEIAPVLFGSLKITNHGTIRGEDWAISAAEGEDHVINRGKLVGSVLLGDGDDTFDNRGGKVIGEVAGGNGNDTYVIDDAALGIFESTSGGVDVLRTSVSYTLEAGNEIEVLWGFGKANIDLTGNDLGGEIFGNRGDNVLSGMGGEDWLAGRKGVDQLTGGDGQDHFAFHIGDGKDTITDFENLGADHDEIVLRKFPGFDDVDDLAAIADDTAKGLRLDFGKGDILIIEGVKLDDLDTSHFDFDV